MTRLVWAQSAIDDLYGITDYLDLQTYGVGRRLVAAIEHRTGLLRDFPQLGEFIPELGLRKLTIAGFPYLLLYDVSGADITIIRVQHTAQNWHP